MSQLPEHVMNAIRDMAEKTAAAWPAVTEQQRAALAPVLATTRPANTRPVPSRPAREAA